MYNFYDCSLFIVLKMGEIEFENKWHRGNGRGGIRFFCCGKSDSTSSSGTAANSACIRLSTIMSTQSGPSVPEVPSSASGRDWVDVTVRLATSWAGLFTAYVAALILGLTKYKELTAAFQQFGLPPWSGIVLIAAFPVCALVFSTILSVVDQKRIRRRSQIKVDIGDRPYFTLRPRETEENIRASRSGSSGRA